MSYEIVRTDTADSQIHSIILFVAEKFGNEIALQKLDALEKSMLSLADNPLLGMEPRYPALKRQGYRVLILEKDLVFYKVNEEKREIVIHAVVDQRRDFLSIIRGL